LSSAIPNKQLPVVRALTTYRGTSVVGGGFTKAGGLPAANIARWNGADWQQLGSGAPVASLFDPYSVCALMPFDDALFVGGAFSSAGGQPSPFIARWGCSCYADCNNDGALTIPDFGCFQTQFVIGSSYADCDNSGNRTVADFGCFQTKFVSGCP
jgi:hypothetical protein